MSLSSLLRENQDVRDSIKAYFTKPDLKVQRPLAVEPQSKRYTLVGTAFDYLFRFCLKFINPNAVENPWVAERSLTSLQSPILQDVTFDTVTDQVVSYRKTDLTEKVRSLLDCAKAQYKDYLVSGSMTEDLLRSAVVLAQIDPIMRAGYVDDGLGLVHDEDVADLRRLVSLIDLELFKAIGPCVLNPTFGSASRLVRGADCDLVIDDMLVEVKTTTKMIFQAAHFDEIIGYMTLIELGGIDCLSDKPNLTRAGIYFSRHGYLFCFDLAGYRQQENFPEYLAWFRKRTLEAFPSRM